jgi:uncharacterized membrane protein YphA (DoxX/SURF4 family)
MSTAALNPVDRELRRRARAERWSWLCLGGRVAVGLLFVVAGVLKLRNPEGFAEAMQGFKLVPDHLVSFLVFGLPWTEVIAGVLLVLGVWARANAILISLLLVSFMVGIWSVIARELSTKCACFGDLEFPCKGEVGACQIIRNAVLLGLLIPVIVHGAGKFSLGSERD